MKKLIILCLMFLAHYGSAQISNGQINYEMRVDEFKQNCDNDGFSNDDNIVRITLGTDSNIGGTTTWNSVGSGTCASAYVRRWSADAPSTTSAANTLLYSTSNRTNLYNYFTFSIQSWESDNNFNCFPVSGDDCKFGPYVYTMTYKSATKTPSKWWGYNSSNGSSDYVTGGSGDAKLKSVWRYSNGNSCGNALNFGTISSGTTYSHLNSNRAAPTGATTTMGYLNVNGQSSPDVYYQFTLSSSATVVISTDNAGTNYDTYLSLYNSTACSTFITSDDDSGDTYGSSAGNSSKITRVLCPGTYAILVEGFSSNSGDFNLSVQATSTSPLNGGTIAGITSPTNICLGTDPGVFTNAADAFNGASSSGTTYQWEQAPTNSFATITNIGANSTTFDLDGSLAVGTYYFRRKVTDACGNVAYSNVVQIIVNPSITPSVAIAMSTPSTNICLGTTVSFTATPTNGGATPAYQWKINGTNTGTNSATIATSELVNANVVTCELTSNAGSCFTVNPAISNTITMSMQTAGSPLSNSETATCLVNGNSWVSFYSSDGRLLGEINAQGNDLGNVQMNTVVGAPQVMGACNNLGNSFYNTAYMGRSWIMTSSAYTLGTDFPSAVRVRLPFTDAELAALNNTAQTVTTGNPLDGGTSLPAIMANMMLTKITGATENGIANNADCSSTIRAITAIAGSGTNIESIGSTQYLDFSINQFSEFFLHKNTNNSALPVTLTNFFATCEDVVTLSWTTASEQNSDRFVIEKSQDGETWRILSEQTAAGNSNTINNYSQLDENNSNGVTYYRLKQIDFNGEEAIYGPISVSCEANQSSMTVYPNPNEGSFTIEIISDEMQSDAQLLLSDISGKIIISQKVNVVVGTTQIMIDNLDLQKGTYLVTLLGTDLLLKPAKVVVK